MNAFVKLGLAALCLGAVSCCNAQNTITIPLGRDKFVYGTYVRYNGMDRDNQHFLLSRKYYTATSYPIQSKRINLGDAILKVNFVCPDSIGLAYLGKLNL